MQERLDFQKPRRAHPYIGIILWSVGVLLLLVAGIIIHGHPGPWPLETSVINAIQGPHPLPCIYHMQTRSWLDAASDFINMLNDPIPAVALPLLWMAGLALFRQFWQALWLGIAVLTASGVWDILTLLVHRPRATPQDGICVHRVINALSFPSGHVMHDVVFYGFLLFLSFSSPVRRWHYRWLLLPLQVLAILYLLAVGYARLEAGEHHFFDVLGAYLTGLLWLLLFIFLYDQLMHWLLRSRTKKNR